MKTIFLSILMLCTIFANAQKEKKSIPYITKPNKQPVATCIDMKTGEFSF